MALLRAFLSMLELMEAIAEVWQFMMSPSGLAISCSGVVYGILLGIGWKVSAAVMVAGVAGVAVHRVLQPSEF